MLAFPASEARVADESAAYFVLRSQTLVSEVVMVLPGQAEEMIYGGDPHAPASA